LIARPGPRPRAVQRGFVPWWWGFPLGPILTVAAILRNLFGGVDVTQQVIAGAVADGTESAAAREYFGHLERAPDASHSPTAFLKELEKL